MAVTVPISWKSCGEQRSRSPNFWGTVADLGGLGGTLSSCGHPDLLSSSDHPSPGFQDSGVLECFTQDYVTRSLVARGVLAWWVVFKKKFTGLALTLAKLTGLTFNFLGMKVAGKMGIAK